MAAKKRAAKAEPSVDAFLATLEHPHKDAIEALRKLILAAAPGVTDAVKWNAPSYRTTEFFATTHLRAKTGVGIVLHRGAKARALPDGGMAVADPTGLLRWLDDDRAIAAFADAADVKQKAKAFTAVLRQWIALV